MAYCYLNSLSMDSGDVLKINVCLVLQRFLLKAFGGPLHVFFWRVGAI